MSWFYEFHCLESWILFMFAKNWEKSRKKKFKIKENGENACQKENDNKFIKTWILCLDIWGWNLKIENYYGEKYFEDLNQN